MCGRYVSSSPPDEIARYFDAEPPVEAPLAPSWNVAPTDDVYVVVEDDQERRVVPMHWGLVPFWAKSPAIGARMINARAEGIATKGAFRGPFEAKRCLVPADGFYEWRTTPGEAVKQPFFIHRADGRPLAFAGLWDRWRNPAGDGGDRLRSTSIITTTPNDLMATLHDRMPVILPPERWAEWLDPTNHDVEALQGLLVPAAPDLLVVHPVSTAVGNVRNDGPELVLPIDPGATAARAAASGASAAARSHGDPDQPPLFPVEDPAG